MERALEGWPDALRAHPMFWLRHWCPAAPVDFEPVRLVRVLNLEQQRLGAALIARLAELEAWHGVVSLNLAGNLLDAEAIKPLASIPFTALRTLNLSQNPLENDAIVSLFKKAGWRHGLRQLDMYAMGYELDAGVVIALRESLGFALERLSLSAGDFARPHLAQSALRERFGARVVFS